MLFGENNLWIFKLFSFVWIQYLLKLFLFGRGSITSATLTWFWSIVCHDQMKITLYKARLQNVIFQIEISVVPIITEIPYNMKYNHTITEIPHELTQSINIASQRQF